MTEKDVFKEAKASYGWTWRRAELSDRRHPQYPNKYSLKSPKGDTFIFPDLIVFVSAHSHLFSPQQLKYKQGEKISKAVYGLASLAPWARNKQESWRGWTWTDETEASPQALLPKEYQFLSPDGHVFKIADIHKFVQAHQKLFAPRHLERASKSDKSTKAARGLITLAPWVKLRKRSWHGWTWHDENNPPPPPREYSLKSPKGKIYKTVNLREFVVKQRRLFTPAQLKGDARKNTPMAVLGLTILAPWLKHKTKRWYGWTWYDEKNPPPPPPPPKKHFLKSPGGKTFTTTDLKKFVVKHSELFTPDELEYPKGDSTPRAMRALACLAPWYKSRLNSWHGWTWHDPDNLPPPKPPPKEYLLKSPKGKLFKTTDLRKFVRKHSHFFTAHQIESSPGKKYPRASETLALLAPWRNSGAKSCYGWTWYDADNPPPKPPPSPLEGYLLRSPQGECFKVTDVRRFVSEHRKLFTEKQLARTKGTNSLRVVNGLLSILPWRVCETGRTYYGWTWHREDSPLPPLPAPREYTLMSPSGKLFTTTDLQQFTLKNKRFFTPQQLEYAPREKHNKAARALASLAPWRKYPMAAWFGWRWCDENHPPPPPPPPPREYVLRAPDGKVFKTTDLQKFTDCHRHLFKDEHFEHVKGSKKSKVYSGLSNLAPWRTSSVKIKSWFGWTWYRKGCPPPPLPPPREYTLISPSGKVFKIADLQQFTLENRRLFAPRQLERFPNDKTTKAARALACLAPWRKNPTVAWHGWRWYDENNPPPSPRKYAARPAACQR